jgi:hypothetical protein
MTRATDRNEFLPGLPLPTDAVTRRLAVVATSGAGKTYGAMKLAELMLDAGHQVIALDVAGPWWGLRVQRDGVSPAFNVAVFGGPHGDVPIVPEAGALVADALIDTRASAVIDLSEFGDSDISRFCSAFAERFFRRKKAAPSPVHLFIEEAHELMPQNPERDQNVMLNRWKRLTRQGRNHGIGWTLVTQSPQSLNKRCLNLAECVVTLRLFGEHERDAVIGWVANVAPDPKKAKALINAESPYLEDGFAFLWSPAWLKIMGGEAEKICAKRTFDSSKTPEPGDPVITELPPPKQLDLAALELAMAETVEKMKAEDPKRLQAEIARLKGELKARDEIVLAGTGRAAPPPPQRIEVPALTEPALHRLEAALDRLDTVREEIGGAFGRAIAELLDAAIDVRGEVAKAMRSAPIAAAPLPARTRSAPAAPAPPRRSDPPPAAARAPNGNGMSGPQQRMINALAAFESIGLMAVSRSNLAVYSDQSPRSSAYDVNISALRHRGLIECPSSGLVRLTDAGRRSAPSGLHPANLEELHGAWIGKLTGPQAAMLRHLIHHYPRAVSRDRLAAATNQSPRSSAYDVNISRLRSLGIVGVPGRGELAATQLLFPEGLDR